MRSNERGPAMKKIISVLLIVLITISMASCGGNIDNVNILEYSSEVYSDEDISSAIETVLSFFKERFEDCTLTEISYAGDESIEGYKNHAERNNADEVIVFISSFNTGSSGGASFAPNHTYNHWNWILIRDTAGEWRISDYGLP